jgi:hypothetical protein
MLVILGRKYRTNQILGCMLVTAGVIIVTCCLFYSTPCLFIGLARVKIILDINKAPWFILDTTGPILGCAGNKRICANFFIKVSDTNIDHYVEI